MFSVWQLGCSSFSHTSTCRWGDVRLPLVGTKTPFFAYLFFFFCLSCLSVIGANLVNLFELNGVCFIFLTLQVHVAGAGFLWDGTRVQPRPLRPVQGPQDAVGEVEPQPTAVQHHVP